MTDLNELFSDYIPSINIARLPREEWEAASKIISHLSSLDTYVRRFRSALELFEWSSAHCEEAFDRTRRAIAELRSMKTVTAAEMTRIQVDEHRRSTASPKDWIFIAANDGALTIYHIGITFRSIIEALTSCPTLANLVGELSEETMLVPYVPDFWSVRNAVAHQAENMAASKKHSTKGPFKGLGLNIGDGADVYIGGQLYNRTYSFTVKGEIRSYDLSRDTLLNLGKVRDHVFSAFQTAAEAMKAAHLASLRIKPTGGGS